jgi:hypothetical protein
MIFLHRGKSTNTVPILFGVLYHLPKYSIGGFVGYHQSIDHHVHFHALDESLYYLQLPQYLIEVCSLELFALEKFNEFFGIRCTDLEVLD